MRSISRNRLTGALAISMALGLSACAGGLVQNRSLYSVKQPVVERTNYTLDVNANASGLPVSEQQRIIGWFDTMDLGFGDRVSLDDPSASDATREAVVELAGRYGVLLSKEAPVTAGPIEPGQARIVLTRSSASVPGCPDWSVKSEMNYSNGLHPGFGCAVNSNLAAMVANPEDLLKGQEGTGETVIATSNKAIEVYRKAPPTGAGGLRSESTGGN